MRSMVLIFFLCLGVTSTCWGQWYLPDEEGRISMGIHHASLPEHMKFAQDPHPNSIPYHLTPYALRGPTHPCYYPNCPYNVEFWLWEEGSPITHTSHAPSADEEMQAPIPVLTFLGTAANWHYNNTTQSGAIGGFDITSYLDSYNFIYDPRALWRRNNFGGYQWVGTIVLGTKEPFSWKSFFMQTLNFTLPALPHPL